MLCEYGCGQESLYTLKNGKRCCSDKFNKCPEARKKNSDGLKKCYKEGRRITPANFSSDVRHKMGSTNRGKNKFNCDHIRRKSETARKNFIAGKWSASFKGKKHSIETKRKIREWAIKYLEDENGKLIVPTKGKFETQCLNEIEKVFELEIDRDKRFIGYFPDGYISDLNIILEFDESFHDNPHNKQRDQERQKELIDFLKCRFFRIREFDWFNNKDDILSSLKDFLQE